MATSYRTAGLPRPRVTRVAGREPGIARLASSITALAEKLPERDLPPAVAEALQPFLGLAGLLAPGQTAGAAEHYRRHLLYADPWRRFSILALVWADGQHTPVHGHTAWGAVGVHRGRLESRNYELVDTGSGLLTCSERLYREAVPGDTSWVQPGLGDIHRLACHDVRGAVSIHVYGRDLTQDPGSINIALPH